MDSQSKSPLLTIAKAAEILELERHTLERMRWQGTGPRFRKQGGRIVYRRDDLQAWAENGRRRHAATLKRSLRPLLGMLAGVALVLAACIPKPPLLVWNASPSVATGLYRIATGLPRLGELVLVRLTVPMGMLADRRGYLPRSAYLLKPVVAVAGDRVCRFGARIFVRRRLAAFALGHDGVARPMPAWQGCRMLRSGEVFLLAQDPASFDGRYFGPVPMHNLVGRAVLLWSPHQSK
jgi:type IV secretory pathway protease TraF